MNIPLDQPQVILLLQTVERKFGHTPTMVNDFAQLSDTLRKTIGERLSQSTLERIWQYSTRNKTHASMYSLNVLARYAGYLDYAHFCRDIAITHHPESGLIHADALDVASLTPGRRIQIAWLPDRLLTIVYRGDARFEVEASENSSLLPGDTFQCLQMQKGQPLYLDRFERPSLPSMTGRYVVGRDTGLTRISLL